MITETRGHIFRWRSRFRRHRVCLSFLLILPLRTANLSQLNMTNHMKVGSVWSRHNGSLFPINIHALPTFLFSRAIAVRQLTFVVVPDNIFWNSCIYIKEIKNAPSALLSYISTREFLRTREKCGEARCEGECFSHFSGVLKNSRVLI